MTKSQYALLLREKLGDIIIDQAKQVDDNQDISDNKEMVVALYLIFKMIVGDDNIIDQLYSTRERYSRSVDELFKTHYSNN